MDVLVQLILNGIMLGAMYAIISVGLTLIFGIVRVVNFAHGEFLMVGMYAVYLLSHHFGLHPYVSAVPMVLMLFAIGALVQRFIIQPLLGADEHIQIFATVGLSTALINLALLIFGADLYSVQEPGLRKPLSIGGYTVLYAQVVIFVSALVLVAGLRGACERAHLAALPRDAHDRNLFRADRLRRRGARRHAQHVRRLSRCHDHRYR